jgi:hypothetical protein
MKYVNRNFLIVAALLALAASLATRTLVSQASSSSAGPLTIRVSEQFYRYPSGEYVRSEERIWAYGADGSLIERRWVKSPAGELLEQRGITNPKAGTRVVLDGLTHSRTTYKLSPQEKQSNARLKATCQGPVVGRIIGYEVVQVERTLAGPPGEDRKLRSWLAPALHCMALKEVFLMAPAGGPLQQVNVREALEVTQEPPDPALFAIPAGYVERTPSEVLEEYGRRYPEIRKGADQSRPALPDADKAYHENAKQAPSPERN